MISLEFIKRVTEWGTVVGLVAGYLRGIYEFAESRKLRAEELRWKKANSAKELLDDIHNHEPERSAVHMLDLCDEQAEYEIAAGQRATVSYADVLAALAKNGSEPRDRKDVYIRDCFDWFFYRVDRIQHYIDRRLIDFDDVKPVFRIYAGEIEKHQKIYDAFLKFRRYDSAHSFFLSCK